MCIRDRTGTHRACWEAGRPCRGRLKEQAWAPQNYGVLYRCLLYTSDAADERSSLDLGGRRIIKKKSWGIEHGGLTLVTAIDRGGVRSQIQLEQSVIGYTNRRED